MASIAIHHRQHRDEISLCHLTNRQIVGALNARTDYHISTTREWFYQYKGSMLLGVVDPSPLSGSSAFRDIPTREGEMFLLPPNVPHNPIRFADTVGIVGTVLEQPRPADSVDKLRWYCQDCAGIVSEDAFHCTDLGTQIKVAVQAFTGNQERRKCGECGSLADVVPQGVVQP